MRNAEIRQVADDPGGILETKARVELDPVCGGGDVHQFVLKCYGTGFRFHNRCQKTDDRALLVINQIPPSELER